MNNLLLAFYGDDFTGSTDALEFLTRAGIKAALFIEPPTPETLALYPGLTALGVAGITRSLSPEAMEMVLRPALEKLLQLDARHVHYKVCSTFDSSPTVGSIGRAIDIGATIFQNRIIPLMVAAPPLGRYCAFGNLFARMGIGSSGKIYRLDRHPSMSKHPVTPSDEGDLRLHLGKQTTKKVGLLDITQIARSNNEILDIVNKLAEDNAEVILIDAVYDEHLLPIGELLDKEADQKAPLFSVGSSGIEMALGKCWNAQGVLQPVPSWSNPGMASPLLVLSGSCSPVTAEQIHWAVANGFYQITIDAQQVLERKGLWEMPGEYSLEAIDLLKKGHSVILHTGKKNHSLIPGEILGTALGIIGRTICEAVDLTRIVVAGGDTSSYAARALGIEAVEMIAPLVPGAPLCKAHAPGSAINGKEINFKGGQVGNERYFGIVKEGRLI